MDERPARPQSRATVDARLWPGPGGSVWLPSANDLAVPVRARNRPEGAFTVAAGAQSLSTPSIRATRRGVVTLHSKNPPSARGGQVDRYGQDRVAEISVDSGGGTAAPDACTCNASASTPRKATTSSPKPSSSRLAHSNSLGCTGNADSCGREGSASITLSILSTCDGLTRLERRHRSVPSTETCLCRAQFLHAPLRAPPSARCAFGEKRLPRGSADDRSADRLRVHPPAPAAAHDASAVPSWSCRQSLRSVQPLAGRSGVCLATQ